MNKNANKKTRALVLISTTVCLLGLWSFYKDYIINENMIGYFGDRDYDRPPKLKSYPKVSADNIYYSKQKVEFSFNCIGTEAVRWILHITGTAFEDNFGTMEITIDDTTKRFRTLAFKHYRYKYVIDFNKPSLAIPKKVRVSFSFSGANSGPLFEMPLVELSPETATYHSIPSIAIIPSTFKRYHSSGACIFVKSEVSGNG